MPLTALDALGATVDATACSDEVWAGVYKKRPRADLSCRDCRKSMHAKVSPRGHRFFAHDELSVGCLSQGETPEHLALKILIAGLIRDAGGRAVLEATPDDTDHGGWRADVLGIGAGGSRIAFEVQLAGMTVQEGQDRTARYAADGINTIWLSDKHAHWMTRLPSCHIAVETGESRVDRGVARFNTAIPRRWQPAEPIPLRKVICGLLCGQVATKNLSLYSEVVDDRVFVSDNAVVLVSRQDLDKEAEHEMALQRERMRQEQEAANRAAKLLALEQRQDRVLQIAVQDAIDSGAVSILLGVPSTWWTGELPVPVGDARGNASTGFGLAVWVKDGPGHSRLRLWAVICPLGHRVSPSLGRSWRSRGVRVYVETSAEAARVCQALHWPARWAIIVNDNQPAKQRAVYQQPA